MKLHLPKGIKSALLACVCGAAAVGSTLSTGVLAGGVFMTTLASQAVAEEYAGLTQGTLTDNGWGNYRLSALYWYDVSDINYVSGVDDAGKKKLYLSGSSTAEEHGIYVEEETIATINAIDSEASADQNYTKLGAGTLIIANAPAQRRPNTINVNEGTLQIDYDGYGIAANVNVLSGATLILNKENPFESSAAASDITLGGGTADGFATLTFNASATSYKSLIINANARINGTGSLTATGATIFNATLTNDTALALNGSIAVAENASLLTETYVPGSTENGFGGTRYFLVKAGDGTGTKSLTVGGSTSTFNVGNDTYTISGGNAYRDVQGTTYYVNRDSVAVTTADTFYVRNNAALTGTADVDNKSITLNNGQIKTTGGTFNNSVTVTLASTERDADDELVYSENTIQMSNGAFLAVIGEGSVGNLTLQKGDNAFNIGTTINHTGNLTLKGNGMNLGADWQKKSASILNEGDVIITGDTTSINAGVNTTYTATIANNGEVRVEGGALNISNGSSINHTGKTNGAVKIDGGTLALNAGSTVTTNALTISSGQLLFANGASLSAAAVTLSGGSVFAGSNGLSLAQDVTVGAVTFGGTPTGTTSAYSGAFTLGATNKTLTFTATAINKGTLTLNGTLAEAANASLTSKASTEAGGRYSDGLNGFAGTTYYLVQGATGSTVTVENTSMGDKTLLTDGGSVYYFTQGTDTTYYVKTGTVTNPSLTGATSVNVAAGAIVQFKDGQSVEHDVTLAGAGSTLWLRGSSPADAIDVTLSGGAGVNHIIKGDQTSVRTNVTGTGDLTLENTGSTFWLKGEVSNTGVLTIKGDVKVTQDGENDDVGKLVLSHTAINNGTLTIDNAGTNLALATNHTLDSALSATSGIYSDGANGFIGTATFLIKEGTAEGTKSLTVGGSTSSFTLGTTTYTISGGSAYSFSRVESTDANYGTYYVNKSLVNVANVSGATKYVVQNNAMLESTDGDIKVPVSLNNGHLSIADWCSMQGDVELLGGDNTIYVEGGTNKDGYSSLMSHVSGVGNLVLTGAGNTVNVFNTLDFVGDLTFVASDDGANITLHQKESWGDHATAANVKNTGNVFIGDTTISGQAASGAYVTMQAGAVIDNTKDLTVATGGTLYVNGDKTTTKLANDGDVNITGGKLTLRTGTLENGSGQVYVSGGTLQFENNAVVKSSINVQTEKDGSKTTHATFSAKDEATYGYKDVAVTTGAVTSIYTDATIKGANINIETEYKLSGGNSNLIVENSTLTVKDALQVEGQVQLKNTALNMQTGGSLDVLASGYLSSSSLLELADGSHSLALNSSVLFGDTTFNIGDAIYTVAETTQINNIVLTGSALFTVELNDELSKVLSAMVKEGETPQNYAVVLKGLTLGAGSTYSLNDPMSEYLTVKNGASYTNYTVSVGTDASGNAALLFTNKVSPLPTPAVPEPATATLSLLALAALAARRRRARG